jgi:Helix-turn-helix domain
MLGGLLTMSAEELDRLGVVRRVLEGRMRLRSAAEVMGISTRQARRPCRAYENKGAEGLVSKARGKASNRRMAFGSRARNESRSRTNRGFAASASASSSKSTAATTIGSKTEASI